MAVNLDMNTAVGRLKKFLLADGAKRMPDATSGHPCDVIILYVLELERLLAAHGHELSLLKESEAKDDRVVAELRRIRLWLDTKEAHGEA